MWGGHINSRSDLALRATRGKKYGGANLGQVPIASSWMTLGAANKTVRTGIASKFQGQSWKQYRKKLINQGGFSFLYSEPGRYEAVERTGVDGNSVTNKVAATDMPPYAWVGGTGNNPLYKGHALAPTTIRYNDGLTKKKAWNKSTMVIRPSKNAPGGWLVYTAFPG